MRFEQMIHFVKQVPGKVGASMFTSLQAQTNPQHNAFLKQLQKELRVEDSLTIPLKELDVVVFDLETTGFFPDKGDEILSIGAIRVKGEKIAENDTFYSLVRCETALSTEIKELTGISEDDVIGAPPLSEVLVEFFKFVQNATLVAHHANHEKQFIRHATWKLFRSQFQHRIVDTSFLVRIAEPQTKLIRLEDCCAYTGIQIEDRHHALGDAKMTAQLWSIYLKKIQQLGCETLQDMYRSLAKFM